MMDWLPDGSFFVADGYNGTRVVKFDADGNFYVAEVDNGGFQKYTPRPDANPDMLIGPPVRSAWE